jgi:cytochrome c-type biogenesis protein CcmH
VTWRGALAAAALVLAAFPVRGQEPSAAAADPRSIVGPPRARPLSGAALEARTEDVASLLRCPVCQGLSVADSPATTALNMKAEVKELLAAGYDQEQILAYFERSYGEFVRLKPPLRGVNWIVWLAPLAALLAGAAVIARALRARRRVPAAPVEQVSPDVPGPDTLPDDPKLAAYVKKARELAYGWPGGVRAQPNAS